jgi:FlaA1/EpsC-like NDP-sugar epimerase
MRILVIGAGRTGARVIQQLQKNPEIKIVTADPREEIYAVENGIIASVDIKEMLTPLNLEHIFDAAGPDLVLMAMPTEDMGLGQAPGTDILADALREEIAATANVPVIEVARIAK